MGFLGATLIYVGTENGHGWQGGPGRGAERRAAEWAWGSQLCKSMLPHPSCVARVWALETCPSLLPTTGPLQDGMGPLGTSGLVHNHLLAVHNPRVPSPVGPELPAALALGRLRSGIWLCRVNVLNTPKWSSQSERANGH